MIEAAAATPRKFGLAPKTSEIFATEAVSFLFSKTIFLQLSFAFLS
jgi:hypothetical protein